MGDGEITYAEFEKLSLPPKEDREKAVQILWDALEDKALSLQSIKELNLPVVGTLSFVYRLVVEGVLEERINEKGTSFYGKSKKFKE